VEAESVQDDGGRKSSRSLVALCVTLVALAAPCAAGLAQAQGPSLPQQLPIPTPTYDIPLPTPTASATPAATPTATPFHDQPQPAPPTGPSLMKPFPTVRTSGNYNRKRTVFTRVKVAGPAGAKVQARCTKRSRKCRTDVSIPRKGALRLKRLQRSFKPKTIIRIRITSLGLIGKSVEIRIRRGKPPKRHDQCVRPGTRKPSPCPR